MSQFFELIAATAWFWTLFIGFLFSTIISIALLFCPTLRWVMIPYFIWVWYDRKTCEKGGRPLTWMRDSLWWRQMKYYFSHKIIFNEDGNNDLDPKKNYLFACFPHGICPFGAFSSFVIKNNHFRRHKAHTTLLNFQFWMPFIRELFLSIGSVSVSAPSIKYLLGKENGGNIVSILIGGGDEAKYSRPGKYKIILNKRKGFVKIALQTGAPIVPVFSFGETDVFDQVEFPGFGCIREMVKNSLGLGLVIPKGRFLIFPNRVPIVTVVGTPIDVQKAENPSNEEIDALHKAFVESLKKLFDEYKYRYVKDPDNAILEIV